MSAPRRVSTVNPFPLDFRATKRRRALALRCEPLASGRRDPDGRPAFDPDGRAYRAAVEHLRVVGIDTTTPPAIRASLAVVLDREAGAA